MDTKKKELVGDFKNHGQEWRPKGKPEQVRVHDFVDPELGRATPYGIYDLGRNSGWVSVGMDHDTAEFAVETIRRWWRTMGQPAYPEATRLLITADAGGSNGSRLRLWKLELQKLADETGLQDRRLSFPAGYQQVEQDRASTLLVHQPELARQASAKFPDHRQSHCRDYHLNRPQGSCRAKYGILPGGHQGLRSGTRTNQHPARQIPRRLELRNPATQSSDLIRLFLDISLG